MFNKIMLTLTVFGSLALALPVQASDRDFIRHHAVQHTQHYAGNQHYDHQPRVVFYFSDHHQPYGYRHHKHHYRHHDRQHYRHYKRHHGDH